MGKEIFHEISKVPPGLCLISMEMYVFCSQGFTLSSVLLTWKPQCYETRQKTFCSIVLCKEIKETVFITKQILIGLTFILCFILYSVLHSYDRQLPVYLFYHQGSAAKLLLVWFWIHFSQHYCFGAAQNVFTWQQVCPSACCQCKISSYLRIKVNQWREVIMSLILILKNTTELLGCV